MYSLCVVELPQTAQQKEETQKYFLTWKGLLHVFCTLFVLQLRVQKKPGSERTSLFIE